MPNSLKRTGAEVKQLMQWLWWAGSDYHAARWLLRGGLLIQGAAFANTAIEKYLKALLSHLGAKIPHNRKISVLFQNLKAQIQMNIVINESFLRLLEKSYKLRYPDLEEGYNIALNQARLLVELDRTVRSIVDRIVITETGTTNKVPSVLEAAIADNDSIILTNNAGIDPSIAQQLFKEPSQSHDWRVLNGNMQEARYWTASVKDEANFELEGFIIVSDGSFRPGYTPVYEPS